MLDSRLLGTQDRLAVFESVQWRPERPRIICGLFTATGIKSDWW